jgi:hypothetical protein
VAGSRAEGELFLLDNTDVGDFFQHATGSAILGTSLGVEAIQEFSVLTNTYSAQFAGNGAVINATTKSGTNNFHGSAYEYLRNSVLDARNFFDGPTIPSFRRNQFGGSLGGPIKKDKLFFFVNYEGFRQSQGQTGVAYVLDDQARLGNVPCNDILGATPGTCANGARVPVTIAPAVENILTQPSGPFGQVYPLPTGPELLVQGGPFNQYPTGYALDSPIASNIGNENYVLGRVDYTFSPSDSIFGRYVSDRSDALYPFAASQLPFWPESDKAANQFFTLEERHIFSPSKLNLARFSFVRTFVSADDLGGAPSVSDPLNFAQEFAPGQGRPDGNVGPGGGGTSLGPVGLLPFVVIQNKFTGGDDFIWNHGAHSLKFGGEVARIQTNLNTPFNEGAGYTFSGIPGFLTGSSVFAFAEPADSSVFATSPTTTLPFTPQRYFREINIEPYFEDDWKVTPRLTLNLGIRYDFDTNPVDAGGIPLYAIPNPLTAIGYTKVSHVYLNNPSVHNIDPRIGLAFDPFHDHKTSIRVGFGIFHDQIAPRTYTSEYTLNPPTATLLVVAAPFPNPFVGAVPCDPSIVTTLGPGGPPYYPTCQPPGEIAGVDYALQHTPYQIQYNLTVQREIMHGTVFSIGYIGSQGVHLMDEYNANPPECNTPGTPLGSTATSSRSVCASPDATFWNGSFGPAGPNSNPDLNPTFFGSPIPLNAGIISAAANGHSSYNSLQLALDRQLTHNLQGQVSYTYSRCIDDGSVTSGLENQTVSQSGQTSSPYNQALDRGPCNFNITHSLRVNSLIALPFKGNRFVEGWQISEILSATTGLPLNVLDGFDQSLLGTIADQRPDYAGAKCNKVTGSYKAWYDPTCYALQPLGTVGDVGRNSLNAPGLLDLDFAILKNTRIWEKVDTQFRAEFFNILNHTNFGTPNPIAFSGAAGVAPSPIPTDQTYNPAAGQITFTNTSSRQIQFAVKFIF